MEQRRPRVPTTRCGVRRILPLPLARAGRPVALAALVLAAAACVEKFPDKLKAGDVVDTTYGSATVELVETGKAGPIYRLVFDRCDPAMAADAFDPTDDAGAPAPPGLQRQWIWKCRA